MKPPNFWGSVIALASLAVAVISLLTSLNKSDRDQTRDIERRLCRIEALNNVGECKR